MNALDVRCHFGQIVLVCGTDDLPWWGDYGHLTRTDRFLKVLIDTQEMFFGGLIGTLIALGEQLVDRLVPCVTR